MKTTLDDPQKNLSVSQANSIPGKSAVEDALQRVLSSAGMTRASRLSEFLRFVVNASICGRSDLLREYEIARQVFGREDDFDPRVDPVVRVGAGQLRYKLREYYATSGKTDPVHIEIPKGSYAPIFRSRSRQGEASEADRAHDSEPGAKTAQDKTAAASAIDQPSSSTARGRRALWAAAVFMTAAALAVASTILFKTRESGSRRPSSSTVAHVSDPAARELYLKGRFHWSKRSPEDLNKAVDYFTQAIVRDPSYAQAYAGLADSYNLLREYSTMPASQAYERAIEAAKKAVELDDTLAEAHNSLAFALFYGKFDSVGAEREFRRAIELDPNYATAHHWYATYLEALGRFHESLIEIERAQSLDPASVSTLADKGFILFYAGRREDAITLLKQMENSDPAFLSPHRYLAGIGLATGNYPEFLAESKRTAQLSHDATGLEITRAIERAYAAGGENAMLRSMLLEDKKFHASGQMPAYTLAQTCSMMNRPQEAIEYLNESYDKREELFVGVLGDPLLNKIRDTAGFKDLMKRARFLTESETAAQRQ